MTLFGVEFESLFDVVAQRFRVHILQALELDVPGNLARAFKQMILIFELGASRKGEG